VSTIGWLTRLILPPACCLCGSPGMEPDFDLCPVCLGLLPRDLDLPEPRLPHIRHVLVPFQYAYPMDHFVRALKFRGERHYGRVLGELLARAARNSGRPPPDLVVPIPLHPSRYRARGFNQAAEIAHHAAARLGLHIDAGALVRVIATREQSGLSLAERRRNIRGAFRVDRRIAARRVALVDDVLTTGSTATEAARALETAGVAEIELWSLARVPLRPAFDYRTAADHARQSHGSQKARYSYRDRL
jgi:ComF family protein